MKTRFLFFLLLLYSLSYTSGVAQNFYNYQKTWATYFGGSGMEFLYGATDSDGNLIVVGRVIHESFADGDEAYYNQFVTSDDPQFQHHPDLFFQTIIAKFSPGGNLL